MPKNLIIIGAGSFGREVFNWAQASQAHGLEWKIKGFIDDNPNALRNYSIAARIISTSEAYQPQPNDVFVCAIGNPQKKRQACQKILQRGGIFTNVIHPSVIMRREVKLGYGVILCPRVTLSCDIKIGNFVAFNMHCCVAHDVTVGDWCQISDLCDLCGKVVLGEAVFLGSHASILPGLQVGDGAVVGAGSVVTKNVPPGRTVWGVPARVLPSRSPVSD